MARGKKTWFSLCLCLNKKLGLVLESFHGFSIKKPKAIVGFYIP